MIVAAGAPSATCGSAAAIAAGSEARAVRITSCVVKTVKRAESGAETETRVQKHKRTKERLKAQEPCATARRG